MALISLYGDEREGVGLEICREGIGRYSYLPKGLSSLGLQLVRELITHLIKIFNENSPEEERVQVVQFRPSAVAMLPDVRDGQNNRLRVLDDFASGK